jgi:hypothetical protein
MLLTINPSQSSDVKTTKTVAMQRILLSFLLILGFGFVKAQNFVPNDSIVANNVFQVEFSDDSRSMVWCQGLGNNRAQVWYTSMNLHTGLPNLNEKQLVDTISGQGWPYWGQDSISKLFVIKNQYGQIKCIRRIGLNTLTTINLGFINNDEKSLINVSSDSTKPYFWINYAKLNLLSTGLDSLFAIASNNLSTRYFVSAERKNQAGSAYELTFPRWLAQSEVLAFPFRPFPNQPYFDMKFWKGENQQSTQVTNDIASNILSHHVDDLPFRLNQFSGDTFMFSSRGSQQVAIYQKSGTYFSRAQLRNPITTIPNPSLTSFEPFTICGNRTYGAYQVYSGGGIPGNTAGEIYLLAIFGDTLHIKISGYNGDVAVDPEYVIGNSKVWIYYYGKPTGPGAFNLHRCETPLTIPCGPLSVNRPMLDEKVVAYPNPFSSRLNIKNISDDDFLVLYNAIAKVIWKGTDIKNEDFSALEKGVYFLSCPRKKSILKVVKE